VFIVCFVSSFFTVMLLMSIMFLAILEQIHCIIMKFIPCKNKIDQHINALYQSYKAHISDMKFRLCRLYVYGQYKFCSVFHIWLLYVIYMIIVKIWV